MGEVFYTHLKNCIKENKKTDSFESIKPSVYAVLRVMLDLNG